MILICEYSNTSKDSEKSILHNDRIDASERSSLTVFWEIYSLKYPIAEYVRSLQSKTPAEKKKNMVMFQRCPQGLRLVGESFDLHHALDRCM